ncbi:MAG TPA: CoA-binding protein [Geobacteraceae bacterium]|nr:CoA-binding protein [Geobacteraceae bacterium]
MIGKEQLDKFFQSKEFGVIGASANRDKYGNKVLRVYLQHGMRVIPVNPKETVIEGIPCVASVADLPRDVDSISVITPPAITEQVVEMAISRGIGNIWMQPGAESVSAVEACRKNGINVIADGSCILVVLGFKDR